MACRVFLGRYETVRLLGEGGMGRVYLARQTDLGRQVVVKVMHDHIASDPKFRERFQREMLLMARFQHPYVVSLYDASLSDPQGPCIIMEYVKGVGLDALIHKNGRLTPARVGRLLSQLCEALYAAHSEGIVHRDLKPSNLMVVDPETPFEKIKVMDFGLAKLASANTTVPLYHKSPETGTDFAVGTPGYISPEQVRGDDVDYRCDLYSVGVILFELLTGRLPFTREDTMDVLFAHATEPPPSFTEVGADGWVSPAVEAVVRRCLGKSPVERPASARDLAQEFQEALNDAGEVCDARSLSEETVRQTAPTRIMAAPRTPAPDPSTIVHHMEAWMPEAIASRKLRGFMTDHEAQVLVNEPGRIRMRLDDAKAGTLSWLGLGRKASSIDMELRLERNNPQQPSQLNVTVIMSSPNRRAIQDATWRERCNDLYCELRSYLAAATVQL